MITTRPYTRPQSLTADFQSLSHRRDELRTLTHIAQHADATTVTDSAHRHRLIKLHSNANKKTHFTKVSMPSCTAPRLAPHPLTSRCDIGAPPSAHARRWSVARLTASSTSYTVCGAHRRRSVAERRTTDGWIVPSPPPTPLCSIDDAAAALSPFSGGAAKIPSDGGTDRHRPTRRSRRDHREICARSARGRREI